MGEGPGFISTFPERSRRLNKKRACREVLELVLDDRNTEFKYVCFLALEAARMEMMLNDLQFSRCEISKGGGFIKFMVAAEEHG